MLSENIKKLRKVKGLSQEELASSLNVVRQTVSKWEKGLSVPDSEMLVKLANELNTTVNILLDETKPNNKAEEIQNSTETLKSLNDTLAKQNESKRKTLRCIFLIMAIVSTLLVSTYVFNEIYHCFLAYKFKSEVTLIGGANGPTTILVAAGYSFKKILSIFPFVIIAIVSWIEFYKTKRK